jgi:glycosyltransferase involved in cell wall biosynthesis
MHIGIAGPIHTQSYAKLLDDDVLRAPSGLGPSDIVQLSRGLLRGGHRVSIYTLSPGLTDTVKLEGKNLKIYFGEYRVRARDRMKDFFAVESNHIRDFISGDNPDLVHAHWTYEFAIGALKSQKPTLITVCDWAPRILRYMPSAYRLVRLFMNAYVIWRGKSFTVVSPYIQRMLSRYKRQNYPVVPSMLDECLFFHGQRKLRKESPKIISINNGFGRLKNVKTLLYAFREVRKELPSCELLLVGDDFGKGQRAEQWAVRQNLSHGVKFLGFLPHHKALRLLEQADLLIHPSKEESFGMVLLEAMAKKTPVIGGASSGAVPWVLDYGKGGILTDINSYGSLAREAISILTDEAKWTSYSQFGYSYAWKNFRLSHVVQKYATEYKKLLSS